MKNEDISSFLFPSKSVFFLSNDSVLIAGLDRPLSPLVIKEHCGEFQEYLRDASMQQTRARDKNVMIFITITCTPCICRVFHLYASVFH